MRGLPVIPGQYKLPDLPMYSSGAGRRIQRYNLNLTNPIRTITNVSPLSVTPYSVMEEQWFQVYFEITNSFASQFPDSIDEYAFNSISYKVIYDLFVHLSGINSPGASNLFGKEIGFTQSVKVYTTKDYARCVFSVMFRYGFWNIATPESNGISFEDIQHSWIRSVGTSLSDVTCPDGQVWMVMPLPFSDLLGLSDLLQVLLAFPKIDANFMVEPSPLFENSLILFALLPVHLRVYPFSDFVLFCMNCKDSNKHLTESALIDVSAYFNRNETRPLELTRSLVLNLQEGFKRKPFWIADNKGSQSVITRFGSLQDILKRLREIDPEV